jgi:glycosyltransferase involved in cell wall biosynthesis
MGFLARASGERSQRPKITVGLPTYNGERFLAEAVRSILDQDVDGLELVIADNASTDATRDMCQQFVVEDRRVRYLPAEQNRGAAWNFNRVVAEASGPYFKWAADDDLYAPGFVRSCIDVLESDPEVVLAYSEASEIDAEGQLIEHRGPTNVAFSGSASERFRAVIVNEVYCYAVFGVIRTESLFRTGLIGPFAQSDRVLLAELALRGRFVELPERLFLHREHEGRSMYAYRDDRDRLRWFDTSRDGSLTLPRWRLGVEHAKSLAVRGAGVDTATRVRGALQLVPWGMANKRILSRELARTAVVRGRRLLA